MLVSRVIVLIAEEESGLAKAATVKKTEMILIEYMAC
jgi:hypothetical protein